MWINAPQTKYLVMLKEKPIAFKWIEPKKVFENPQSTTYWKILLAIICSSALRISLFIFRDFSRKLHIMFFHSTQRFKRASILKPVVAFKLISLAYWLLFPLFSIYKIIIELTGNAPRNYTFYIRQSDETNSLKM